MRNKVGIVGCNKPKYLWFTAVVDGIYGDIAPTMGLASAYWLVVLLLSP